MHALLALVFGFSAQAIVAPSKPVPSMKCESAVHRSSFKEVSIFKLSAGTKVKMVVKSTAHGESRTETYNVKLADNGGRVGAPVTYTGEGTSLSVNFTTAPGHSGRRLGKLKLPGQETEDVDCWLVVRKF